MEKRISYLNRTFHDYRSSLLNYTKQYYPELEDEFNDASIGSWLIDVVANVGDNLSYHIDRVYQETNIDSAQERASVYALAKSNGLKIPGPKASMAEVEFSCEIPIEGGTNPSNTDLSSPDWSYAPLIKQGTKLSAVGQIFELMHDVDFQEQFNEEGVSNRTIVPKRDSNGFITKYVIRKTGIVAAGETKIYTKVIESTDLTPFMSFTIPDTNVMNIESIIFKDGTSHSNTPTMSEFYYNSETNTSKDDCGDSVNLWRFFEVDYLAQQYRWGDYGNNNTTRGYDGVNGSGVTEHYITKGAWLPLRQKFMTEFTDKGFIKVTFGAGNVYNETITNVTHPTTYEHIISHMVNNDGLGVLPPMNTTMYIMYRKGGGAASNVAQGVLSNITYFNGVLRGADANKKNAVKRSITVINTTPSVSGRDMPSIDEIKHMVKYNNGAQERCVTLKDYYDRISKMPPKYGCPYRYGVIEENNKVMIYTLGLDSNGKLTEVLPDILCENLQNYLSEYRMINDYIEIKSGRIINLQFEIDLFVDKNYNTSDVLTNVINCVTKYMSIEKNQMGDDIFVGDIEKEISKVDGVQNLIDLRVYNIYDDDYSSSKTLQQIKTNKECYTNDETGDNIETLNRDCIDLLASDKMLYTENDTMFEIRYPEKDIICRVKTR